MKLIEIIYIELNSSKTYCNTEYLREEFLSKIKLNGEKIEANLYKIKADISFVIYQNKSSEGFLDKDGKCSLLNKAILFSESTSAEKFCKLRNIDNYKVFQISLKTFKESCNYNCQSGDLLNILLSNQEKEILEQQNLVIEIELLNKKIKKYETILQENNLLSINQEQFSKKINKI